MFSRRLLFQPGDLIFYSGAYYKEDAKPQLHDMVHVEIFLGGEVRRPHPKYIMDFAVRMCP